MYPNYSSIKTILLTATLILIMSVSISRQAFADSAAEIDSASTAALNALYANNAEAKKLGQTAKGILIFPKITKGGFVVGGQSGEGALQVGGKTTGYFRCSAASFGLQAGVQNFGYAMFLMDDASVQYVQKSDGWEIGTGPSVVVLDAGAAKSMSTSTAKEGIYAFIFDQKGLMGGIGLQGTKISKIDKK